MLFSLIISRQFYKHKRLNLQIKYWPWCSFQFCACHISDLSLLILTALSDAQFFTFSYRRPPAAIISLPVRPQDYIILSNILSWPREIFSSVFTVKKRIRWIAHAIPDVTKSAQTPWHKVQQSSNRFRQVINLKRNMGFKPPFIDRNSRQVGNSQRFFWWGFLVSHDLLNFAFVLSWVNFCGPHYNLCIICTDWSQSLKMGTHLWGARRGKKVIWHQANRRRLTRNRAGSGKT